MLSVKIEEHVNVKFLAKLGKFTTETYSLLMEVYGDECLSCTQVSSGSKGLKREEERPKSKSNFKAMMIVFLISKGLFTLIGCLKIRPLIRSTIRRF
jgi:hypothetical protein